MNTILAQLKQWPPTVTTVMGVGILLGLGSYFATGSFEIAVGVAGIFKLVCPQDAAVVDSAIDEASKIVALQPVPKT